MRAASNFFSKASRRNPLRFRAIEDVLLLLAAKAWVREVNGSLHAEPVVNAEAGLALRPPPSDEADEVSPSDPPSAFAPVLREDKSRGRFG